MKDSLLRISVIIPTRGRDACLRQTLRDLAAQEYREFDIWVVDQNDAPLKSLHAEVGDVFLHHELMPPRGSHAGRNHAIFKTTAELCVFVDDDVRVEPDFLRLHSELFVEGRREHPNLAGIAGRVIQPKDGLSENEMTAKGEFAKYNTRTGRATGNFFGTKRGLVEHMHECNFSALTRSLREVGGFNEEFQGNAYFEGTDLALRLQKNGGVLLYDPRVKLIHLQSPSGGNRVKRKSVHNYWMMRNYCLLNSLHLPKTRIPIFVAWSTVYTLAKAAKNRDTSIALEGLKGLFAGSRYLLGLTPNRKRSTS